VQVEVEVNVQDCFFTGSQANVAKPGESSDAIASETWQNWFCKWLEDVQLSEPLVTQAGANTTYELSLRLTDNQEIQTLNAQYRHQNQPTDVLAFAALEVDYPQPDDLLAFSPLYLGDIVISVETAHRQAEQQGHSLKTELAWLAAHGLLHLLGWDHPDEDSLTRMLNQQAILLKTIGLAIQTG
jgi:probable rRNA maturation factor